MKKCRFLLVLMLILFCGGITSPRAQEVGEYHIKAVFLLNLTHFVNWPAEAMVTEKPFIIGIYGPDPFGSILDRVISGEKVRSRTITIKRYSRFSELALNPCDLLFIQSSKFAEWPQLSQYLAGSPILTVADSVGFPEQGGMVNLLKNGQTIQIQINHDAVLKSGLTMSAKLLNLAHLVK